LVVETEEEEVCGGGIDVKVAPGVHGARRDDGRQNGEVVCHSVQAVAVGGGVELIAGVHGRLRHRGCADSGEEKSG
jgi:hypothetical protein